MHSGHEMLELNIATDEHVDGIRATIMPGPSAHLHAAHDLFQDFDLGHIVTDAVAFRNADR
jgi:hypothetical protein